MAIETDKAVEKALSAIADRLSKLETLNIIVAGKTGAGKSTLVNAVFRERLCETGMGRPVTGHMRKISKKDVPLTIYDTRGFELGKDVQDTMKAEVMDTIRKGAASKDGAEAVHCIWYCINTASNRIEEEEIQWISDLARENRDTGVPIILVLTQSFSKKKAEEMKQALLRENLPVAQIVTVLAEAYEINEDYTAPAFGLDVLISVMVEVLPETLLDTLQNVQIASLEAKRKRARKAVKTAVMAAMAEGASPLPFADSALLIPTQLAMIASITAIYGIDVNKSIITAFLSSTIGSGGATFLGKSIVSGLMKFLPGAGTAASAVSAATAGSLTAALGEAYIRIMERIYTGELSATSISSDKEKKEIAKVFKESLKKETGFFGWKKKK